LHIDQYLTGIVLFIFLISGAAFAKDGLPAHLDCESTFLRFVQLERNKVKDLLTDNTILVRGVAFRPSKFLGQNTGGVFLTLDGKKVVKIYDSPEYGLQEYWATKFLQSKGEPVPDVTGPPEKIEKLPAEIEGVLKAKGLPYRNVWITTKEYLPGFNKSEIAEAGGNMAVLNAKRQQELNRIKGYFTRGEYKRWLESRGIDYRVWDPTGRIVEGGQEVHEGNFLFTWQGWQIFDL
jgi:hypothetical protein